MCDGIDNDCDAVLPPDELDSDGDGWFVCDGDCDDTDAYTWPGATERCDRADNDCDGSVPANEADDDGDGWSVCASDCDDGDAAIHPAADEDCTDGIDNDCDGLVDGDAADGDGDGWTLCDGDSDAGDGTVIPAADEGCDGIDTDCDSYLGDDEMDDDGDGFDECGGDCDDVDPAIHPSAAEDCGDVVDNDCDGAIDVADAECPGDPMEPLYEDDGTICAAQMGSDEGLVPTWPGACDPLQGYHAYGNHCFYPVFSSANWITARATCRAAGGYLSTIADEEENNFATTLSTRFNGGGCDADVEGTWQWVTGEPWTFENFSAGEPNDLGGEDCLAGPQGTYGGTMNDIDCTNNPWMEGYTCEFGPFMYADADGDGWTPTDGDCTDYDASVNPGALEDCGNGVDDDCDGTMDGDDLECAGDDDTGDDDE